MSIIRLLIGCIFVVLFSCAAIVAQENKNTPITTANDYNKNKTEEYLRLCKEYNLSCILPYDLGQKTQEKAQTKKRSDYTPPRDYSGWSSGGIQIAIIGVIILVVLLLWLRFGNGGMLLSSEPSQKKKPQEKPENWKTVDMTVVHHIDSFIDQLQAMQNRTEALVLLLRHCLIYAADMSNTRLARSDTERTVLRRLPKDVSNRASLENLLYVTELAHYGGQNVEEENFQELVSKGKQLLRQGKKSHE